MTLVEPPALENRNPHQIHFSKHTPECPDGTFQYRGIGNVKNKAPLPKEFTRIGSLSSPLLGQIDIIPSSEAIFLVPLTFSMPQQDQLDHSYSPFSGFFIQEKYLSLLVGR
jgi:hypothetical protein